MRCLVPLNPKELSNIKIILVSYVHLLLVCSMISLSWNFWSLLPKMWTTVVLNFIFYHLKKCCEERCMSQFKDFRSGGLVGYRSHVPSKLHIRSSVKLILGLELRCWALCFFCLSILVSSIWIWQLSFLKLLFDGLFQLVALFCLLELLKNFQNVAVQGI